MLSSIERTWPQFSLICQLYRRMIQIVESTRMIQIVEITRMIPLKRLELHIANRPINPANNPVDNSRWQFIIALSGRRIHIASIRPGKSPCYLQILRLHF